VGRMCRGGGGARGHETRVIGFLSYFYSDIGIFHYKFGKVFLSIFQSYVVMKNNKTIFNANLK
jgi:hypothetical protein